MRATTFRLAALTYTPSHAKMIPHKVTVVSDEVMTTALSQQNGCIAQPLQAAIGLPAGVALDRAPAEPRQSTL